MRSTTQHCQEDSFTSRRRSTWHEQVPSQQVLVEDLLSDSSVLPCIPYASLSSREARC